MSRRREQSGGQEQPPEETSIAEPVAETAPPEETSAVWLVSLNCPTPLREREAMIEAPNENAAWEAFKRLNGIDESDHPRTITRA